VKAAGLEQVVSTAVHHVQTALQQGEHIPSLLCTRVVGSKRACIPPKRHFVSLTHSLAPSVPPLRAYCAPCSPPCCCARICAHLVPAAAQHVKEAQGEHIPSILCTRAVGSKRGCIPVQRHLFTYHCMTHSLPSPLRSCSPPSYCARICAHHDTHPSRSRHTLAWRHDPRSARR
jgi:hypothetical protein